jgi:hypothetical protein
MVYSAANVQQIILMPQSKMSVIDLMRFDTLAISEKALEGLQQRLVVQMLGNNRRLNSLKQHTVLTHSKLMDRLEAAAEEEEAARARHAA